MRVYQRILGAANVPQPRRPRGQTLSLSLEPEPEVRRAPVAAPAVVVGGGAAQRMTAEELGTQTIKQLQDTARAMGISTGGRKATLIARIVGA